MTFGHEQIQAAFRTDEIQRTPRTPQDEMIEAICYFHETIWNGVPIFLRRVDTALKNFGVNEYAHIMLLLTNSILKWEIVMVYLFFQRNELMSTTILIQNLNFSATIHVV